MMSYTLGSLFDGSGGFPLAGYLCGFEPVWASEIEPYPIAVTKNRFPEMTHLGDIGKLNGRCIPPVDIITFGSPCQNLSQAGNRTGLSGEKSSLFHQAIRIIKEMREATNGEFPKFAIWENVMGAFSSNSGEDFRTVLEELIKIVEPSAIMPPVPKTGWSHADCYCGDGWSLAYRVLDSQYIRTAQRRKRIYLVIDFAGERAFKILFERESLRGYYPPIGSSWKDVTEALQDGTRASYAEDEITYDLTIESSTKKTTFESHPMDSRIKELADDISPMVSVKWHKGTADTPLVVEETLPRASNVTGNDARGNGDGNTVSTITGDHENRITDYTSIVISSYGVGNGQANQSIMEEQAATLNCMHDQQAVCIVFDKEVYNSGVGSTGGHYISEDGITPALRATGHPPGCAVDYVVRRLTPVECARLQGFPDDFGEIEQISEWTYTDHVFWSDVRNTHAAINGKEQKEYSEKQMQSWYNKLHTDSAEYRLWGNGVALPCATFVMQGIADTYEN